MAIRQGIRIKAVNRNAKYKKKYTVSQVATSKNGIQTTKYTYSVKIVNKKKYSYAQR